VAPIVMIRRGPHKYIHCSADPDQLYDVAQDPHELHNLAGEDRESGARLRAEARARWSLESLHAQVLASQRRRRLVASALALGKLTPWDYQPTVDASRQYVRNSKTLDEIEAAARFPRGS
jgi:choline-sulfatase